MKGQMREANRRGAALVVIAGSHELASRAAQVKRMADGQQRSVPFDDLESTVQELLESGERMDAGGS